MRKRQNQNFIRQALVGMLVVFLLATSVAGVMIRDVNLSVYTDKPTYYRGESVVIFGWLTENGVGIPMGGICINVTDPEEIVLFAGCFITNDTGYYDVILDLAPDATLGVYHVHVEAFEYQLENSTTFEVIIPNDPPDAPVIDGPTEGEAGVSYDYTFVATDPDENDVYYWIVWGDGCPAVEWIGPFASDEVITVNHTFAEQGTYTISAKAKDIHELEGPWGFLDVEMPVNLEGFIRIFFEIFSGFFERFPLLENFFISFFF